MININVVAFADESEVVSAVAKELGISHHESECLYVDLGGYSGNGPITFDNRWPDDDPFSIAVQEFMTSKGIQTLRVGYDD